tara:strand:- start:48380 stop:49276 length:897 start_codon:yes stop_codon:yes gene_type:complete
MSVYFYPIFSAILWAICVPILNLGLKKIDDDKPLNILWPLLYSIATGATFTYFFGLDEAINFQPNNQSIYLMLAGILTYPLATGSYYIAGLMFKDRIELASQFSKTKPGLTLLLALALLPASMQGSFSLLGLILLFMGIGTYIFAGLRKNISLYGAALGLITALLWSFGEITMKYGIGNYGGFAANFYALCYGTLFLLPIVIAMTLMGKIKFQLPTDNIPFLVHGVLSFFLAYSLFFSGLDKLGVIPTVVINAFWPLLALIITTLLYKINKQSVHTPKIIWLGSLLFLSSGLVTILMQ